ncbi:MAG TPA: GNAT family protein [Candidatus Baltobacteraceae bacterium]|jgi:RimJ/RimL family protein N-acetyltransferase|nr:GNAT family protein [Candidatus Baltobacteraceae bacterium]
MLDHTFVLETARVRLEPLDASHLEALIASCNDPALWEFTFQPNPFTNDVDARRWLEAAHTPSSVPFAIIDRATGLPIGSTRYHEIVPEHRKLEIGWTFVARSHWRTHVNTECKYLLLRHAFDEWSAVRVQLKGEARNARSREAMARIGATYEGTMRNFRIRPDGERRDVSYYSITADEWPGVRTMLEARIGHV